MDTDQKSKLADFPPSDDLEFWGEGQRHRHQVIPIPICKGHNGKKWLEMTGYIDNHDGTIFCKWCPWGTQMPGYIKCVDGRIIDLWSISRK